MIFHSFLLGDVEDPDLYSNFAISEWQETKKGSWCMKNATKLEYHIIPVKDHYGYKVDVTGKLSAKKSLIYFLKFA
jgi:hypothetical protein